MVTRVAKGDLAAHRGQNADMERVIAVSRDTVGSERLYTSVVTTAPRGRTEIHHHGECETSIYILSGKARFYSGDRLGNVVEADAGDFIYVPAFEVHVEENASASEPLVVILSRNCAGSVVHYVERRAAARLMVVFGSLAALLEAHGLGGVAEAPFEHTGFSGARLTRLVRKDGSAFILKRLDTERDWIMRATDDVSSREAALAAADLDLGETIRTPAIGVARDGDAWALLMADISTHMLAPGPISTDVLKTIIERTAELHRRHVPLAVPWCDLTRRLTLLTPATARVAEAYGAPVARDIIEGWGLFDELAAEPVRSIISRLRDDASPLVAALHQLPVAYLHGDLKLDNIGLDADGAMWLIDWALTLVAPTAVELGWFMAINSRRLPVPLDDVMDSYAAAAGLPDGVRRQHDALTVLCGLLLRGWRKALDAHEGEAAELGWWCDRAERAAELL